MGKIAENISKDLVLEVFERDSFTCQECGKKVPSVVLLVLYKISPEHGGKDEVENLITCCHECVNVQNLSGMKIIKREQLEMFFYWKQVENTYDEDVLRMLVEYINEKIKPFYLLKKGELKVKKELKKNELNNILDVIDKAYDDFIEYDDDDRIIRESAVRFMNNIPAYLAMKRKSEVEQKIHYIRGICRKRFNYCNEEVALDLLQEYVQVLREYGYSEEAILKDLTTYLQSDTIKCRNWSQWRDMVEQCISYVREKTKHKNGDEDMTEEKSISDDDVHRFSFHECNDVISRIELLLFLHKAFPKSTKAKQSKLAKDIYRNTYEFLSAQKDLFLHEQKKNKQGVKDLIEIYSVNLDASEYFYSEGYDENLKCKLSFGARYIITEEVFYNTVENILHSLNYAVKKYDFSCTIKFIDLAMQMCASKYNSIK